MLGRQSFSLRNLCYLLSLEHEDLFWWSFGVSYEIFLTFRI